MVVHCSTKGTLEITMMTRAKKKSAKPIARLETTSCSPLFNAWTLVYFDVYINMYIYINIILLVLSCSILYIPIYTHKMVGYIWTLFLIQENKWKIAVDLKPKPINNTFIRDSKLPNMFTYLDCHQVGIIQEYVGFHKWGI